MVRYDPEPLTGVSVYLGREPQDAQEDFETNSLSISAGNFTLLTCRPS